MIMAIDELQRFLRSQGSDFMLADAGNNFMVGDTHVMQISPHMFDVTA